MENRYYGLKKLFYSRFAHNFVNSFTNRHLCEFTGLDMEMEFNDHYFEVLDILGEMMVFLTNNLKKRYAKELAVINE